LRINLWAICLAFLLAWVHASFAAEMEWQSVIGHQPQCPKQAGGRMYRSEILKRGNSTASIVCTSQRDAEGCHYSAEIQIEINGEKRSYPIPNPSQGQQHEIVDFSPDASQLLIRGVQAAQVGVLPLPDGEINWQTIKSLFSWGDCAAQVMPQGFLANGKAVIQTEPSPWPSTSRPANCVDRWGFYEVDFSAQKAVRLPNSPKIEHYGKIKRLSFQACKSDPDIVAECFTIHGRISVYNGSGVRRIWRIGTKRMLYVPDEFAIPESLRELTMGVDIYGDFLICPLEKQKPGHMQRVCIEKAQHLAIDK
jgi:hypothetical protein